MVRLFVVSLDGLLLRPTLTQDTDSTYRTYSFVVSYLGKEIGCISIKDSDSVFAWEIINLIDKIDSKVCGLLLAAICSFADTKCKKKWVGISPDIYSMLHEGIEEKCEIQTVDDQTHIHYRYQEDVMRVEFHDSEEYSKISVEICSDDKKSEWDRFVSNSINGTFLQSMRFLDYHPDGRFDNHPLMVRRNKELIAVMPGCRINNTYFSHRGSTFGGILVNKEHYNVQDVKMIMDVIDNYLYSIGINKIIIKPTSNLFCDCPNDLFDYMYYKRGYEQYSELSFFIDCSKISDSVIDSFTKHKRKHYKESQRFGLSFKEFSDDRDIERFHSILSKNLLIHEKTPTHSLEELLDLYHNRIGDIITFYGVFLGDKMIAGTMLFKFSDAVVHTQYIATDYDYGDTQCTYYLYGKLIETIKQKGFKTLSFGISTESNGLYLNEGLASLKEGFGSSYSINHTYTRCWSD